MTKTVCIVGGGAAGILTLLALKNSGISPKRITMIDPYFDGGDLSRKWSAVKSNTVWRQILETVPPPSDLPEPYKSLDQEQPCLLGFVIKYLYWVAKPFLTQCDMRTGLLESADFVDGQWIIKVKGTQIKRDVLIMATGSEPKTLDLPFHAIPLEIALTPSRLQETISKGDHVMVFGSAHSGVLVVKNLVDLGATVSLMYVPPKPFFYDAEGDYDGMKWDAATIAKEIEAGKMPEVELCSISDLASTIRATKKTDYVVYAMGFEQRMKEFKEYTNTLGRLGKGENAWAFGIAYPNIAPDGIHYDVSIPAFNKHIQRQLPEILSILSIEQ